ncbi:MAG TPA: GNAT family N-acetyltransferase [Terriglobales bacterium]|nr:GNAT family N-acetyltransferase [Terriglobales bacterium]
MRRAAPDDAPKIAELHIRTWQIAYRGQLPDDYLDGLDRDLTKRSEFWRAEISAPPVQHEVWLADADEQILGFISIGPSRDEDCTHATGELYAIYVNPKYWHEGAGRALALCAKERLASLGFSEATLWVLESNQRAREFYVKNGWIPDTKLKIERRPGGIELREMRYSIQLE